MILHRFIETVRRNVTGLFLTGLLFANAHSDEAIAVGVDSADNVIVTGRSVGLGSGEDIYTVRYAAATGVPNGEFRYTGAGLRTDYPVDLAIDSNGNAIVAGVTTNTNNDTDIYLAKINLNTQTATWTQTIASPANVDDEGKAVAVDSSDNVVVTGILRNSDNTHAFHTRKYSSAGVFQWEHTFQSPVDDFNGPTDVAVDSLGNAIVTGTSTFCGPAKCSPWEAIQKRRSNR